MTKYALIAVFGFLISEVSAQFQGITQGAEGTSTIPVRGSTVGFDLTKTDLSLSANNLAKASQKNTASPILSSTIKVKNNDGIGSLFSGGNIVAEGNLNGLIGITLPDISRNATSAFTKRYNNLDNHYLGLEVSMRAQIVTKITALINSLLPSISNLTQRTNAQNELNNLWSTLTNRENEYYDAIKNLTPSDPQVVHVYSKVKTYALTLQNEYSSLYQEHQAKLQHLHLEYSNINYSRLSIFGYGGITALEFKVFDGFNLNDPSKSFSDIKERSGNIGLGINYQHNAMWLGITYSYEDSNNLSELKKKEYSIKTTIIKDSISLTQEDKFSAYTGTFSRHIRKNQFNVDLIFRINLDDEYKNFLLLNPYVRASVLSGNTELLTNKTNVGLGCYFFQQNGKFNGGFYVELPDVNNNIEKKKPALEQNIQPPLMKLTFGIVAKYTLGTFIGW